MTSKSMYCDDGCGVVMAKVVDGKLVIVKHSHGRKHVLVLPLDKNERPVVQRQKSDAGG